MVLDGLYVRIAPSVGFSLSAGRNGPIVIHQRHFAVYHPVFLVRQLDDEIGLARLALPVLEAGLRFILIAAHQARLLPRHFPLDLAPVARGFLFAFLAAATGIGLGAHFHAALTPTPLFRPPPPVYPPRFTLTH